MIEQSETTTALVKRWLDAQRALDSLKSQINAAECELRNAINSLGKQLCPEDAIDEEGFSIWVRTENLGLPKKEMLLNVYKKRFSDYHVEWRKKPQPGKMKPAPTSD